MVEKFGYGFSDIVDKSRDIDSILEDTNRTEHYVHDYEYEKISEETVKFLTDIR